MKPEYFLTLYTKINSKWIKDINIKPNNISHLDKTGRTLFDINCINIFWDLPPRVMKTKTIINKYALSNAFAQKKKS